jgi:acetyl-CoA carboxylase biotin carboxylase subunit
MLAKLIVWAPARDAAIARMHRALLELTIDGVATSRDFHLRVMEDAEFRRGDIEIQWLERRLESLTRSAPPAGGARVAAIAAVLLAERDRVAPAVVAAAAPSATSAGGLDAPQEDAWLRAGRRDGLRRR